MKLVYVKNSGMWLVYNCSGIQMVCESHKMSKIDNSGIQTGICENLVYIVIQEKKLYKVI